MIVDEELRKYLPKYLSEENYRNLLSELKSFPDNIDARMYTSSLNDEILYQGDGIDNMPIIDLAQSSKNIQFVPALILSNTCDMDLSNKRMLHTSIVYAPIIKLSRYQSVINQHCYDICKIENHIADLKQQKITQIMYLPATGKMEESVVLLDRIFSINNKYVNRSELKDIRFFSFSDYGFYLFVFKLSVHFSRIQEKVNRGMY